MNRALHFINCALFLLGVCVIAIVVNVFSRQDTWRARIDATKTRAYSLSDQTQQLLNGLQGQWTIAIIMDEFRADRSMRRQIDEVLKRYTDASSAIRVMRIDPSRPQTLMEYERLLSQLNTVYTDSIAAYEAALNAGVNSFESLQSFALQQGGTLEQLVTLLPDDDPAKEPLRQRLGALLLLADQGAQIVSAVAKARRVDRARPLPDYETARSTLAAALSQSAGDLDELAGVFDTWQKRAELEPAEAEFIAGLHRDFASMSQQLAEAADPLKRLPPLELSSIGTQLQQGEAAIIIGPQRAAIIPSAQLFPKRNITQHEDQRVTFDQRFRGEQLITATIRSLSVDAMPLVMFVHTEEGSMLRPRPNQADLVGIANLLKASRFEVAEWSPATQSTRPTPEKNQRIVWVIIPPMQRTGIQISKQEESLLAAVRRLIDDGEPILLSAYPSILPRYGQPDPWARLPQPFGMSFDTSQVVYEQVRMGEGEMQNRIAQLINEYPIDHIISRAIEGLDSRFSLPIPITMQEGITGIDRTGLASIAASPDRWTEPQWTTDPSQTKAPTPERVLQREVPVAVAAERIHPVRTGMQRVICVGAGAWMLSYEADLVVPIGGNRVALVYPGNNELMLASIAWLAGMDDLIAASPVSQEVSRLKDVTESARLRWMWITVAGMPGLCIVLGITMWLIRRR